MGDLISRADALTVLSWFTQTDPLGHTPCQLIEALPSADAVQVVRCEDCKHYRSFNTTERKYSKCDGLCRRHLGLPKDENGFCSDGEWKEE